HEVLRVRPVVGDLARVVPTHDVGRVGVRARGVVRIGATPLALLRLGDEPVHLPAVDVGRGRVLPVRTAAVDVVRVVEGLVATVRVRHRYADRRLTDLHGDPVGTGERAEVGVERTVLLHDH